jgi:PAS domain S-box-containing protein
MTFASRAENHPSSAIGEPPAPVPDSLYRSLVESIPGFILLLDKDGTVRYANRTIPEIDPAAFLGSSAFDWVAPESEPALRDAMNAVATSGRPASVEVLGVALGGASAWGEVQLGPVVDRHGTVIAFALAIEDINERRRIEAIRRSAEERYAGVFHRSPYPMLIFDPETRLVHNVNAAALDKYGYDRDDFIGLDLLDLHPEESRPQLLAQLAAGLSDFNRGFTSHRLADGRVIDVEVTGQSFEAAGRKLRMVFIEDITEARRATEALARSEAANRALIGAIPDLIFRISRDGRYLSFVPADEFPLAGSPEEFLGKPLESVLPPDIAERARGAVAGALATSRLHVFEYRLEVEGVTGTYEARIVPIHGADEVVAIIRDVTEAVEAQTELIRSAAELEQRASELERSNTDLAQFAHAVSHDLSEPLRAISMYANLFAGRFGEQLDEEGEQFLQTLTDGVGRMQTMIRDLLEYSRATTADQTFESVDLNTVAGDVLNVLADRIDATGATVTIGELPTLKGDASQLRQVLQNLISNSLKFVEPGTVPDITVSAELREDLWHVSVLDNGLGIEPRFQARVFIPFRRLNTQDQYPGTGVGLSIAKRIVERHGGTIWMDSRPGGGSVFSFTIPNGNVRS